MPGKVKHANSVCTCIISHFNWTVSGAIAQALVKKCPNILPECQQKSKLKNSTCK